MMLLARSQALACRSPGTAAHRLWALLHWPVLCCAGVRDSRGQPSGQSVPGGARADYFRFGIVGLYRHRYGSVSAVAIGKLKIPWLSEPARDRSGCVQSDPLVYFALLAVQRLWWFLYRTKAGLVLRIVGESPAGRARHRLSVIRIRLNLATVFGGANGRLWRGLSVAGLPPAVVDDMSAGRGWIALRWSYLPPGGHGASFLAPWLFAASPCIQLFAPKGFGLGYRRSS